MSIKTTQTITRDSAIRRIKEVAGIANEKNYKLLEDFSFETKEDIQKFVDQFSVDISGIENWTNRMLEDIMDKPFFRHSMFDNYFVR